MKSWFKRFHQLIGLACIIGVAFALFMLGLPAPIAFAIVALWQLSQFALSNLPGFCFTTALTPEQLKEFQTILEGLKTYDGMFKDLEDGLELFELLRSQRGGETEARPFSPCELRELPKSD